VFTDPYQWYGRLSDNAACHAAGGHRTAFEGWTREQAIQYMLDNSMAESDVIAEVERYIVWSARRSAIAGQLRITELRGRLTTPGRIASVTSTAKS
jgi:uncharacterized protein (DUF885 family)